MKLIIDDKIPYIAEAATTLGEVHLLPGSAITAADVRDADALIVRTRTHCDERLLAESQVQFIATATIGYDHIDTHYLAERGIAWTNCPGCNAESVAQYVLHSLYLLDADGMINLSSATIGIVGVGNVGSAVECALRRVGCQVLLCDPPRQEHGDSGFCEWQELAERCDVLTLHTPLTRDGNYPTFHMVNMEWVHTLQRRPVLINAARGEVMDTSVVLHALDQGILRAAVIDTWEEEPHIDRRLLERAYLSTPHIAGYSADGKANGTRMALEAVAKHFGKTLCQEILPPALPSNYIYYPEKYDPRHPYASSLRLYDPRRDSDALKAHPEQFEALRGHYPLRRETD